MNGGLVLRVSIRPYLTSSIYPFRASFNRGRTAVRPLLDRYVRGKGYACCPYSRPTRLRVPRIPSHRAAPARTYNTQSNGIL
jgi:hypothetical protein